MTTCMQSTLTQLLEEEEKEEEEEETRSEFFHFRCHGGHDAMNLLSSCMLSICGRKTLKGQTENAQ